MLSVDSNRVDSVLRALMDDGESTTLEADVDEDPPKIILEEDDEALADLYMPRLMRLVVRPLYRLMRIE